MSGEMNKALARTLLVMDFYNKNFSSIEEDETIYNILPYIKNSEDNSLSGIDNIIVTKNGGFSGILRTIDILNVQSRIAYNKYVR